jgi:SAM-dependent methyltransferase
LRWAERRKYYSALSVRDAFSDVYRNKAWGETEGEAFCSGFGSDESFGKPYPDWVTRFAAERKIRKIVDLGCGDFRVGRRICANYRGEYIGVDVVPDLVKYNQQRFGSDTVAFRCANIIEDELPSGEFCMMRQVLQHLSNAQIKAVLERCKKYPYLLVTEDVYAGPRMRPNLDKPHGADNRFYDRSGVYLDLPPYSLPTKTVLEIPTASRSVLRTWLIEQKGRR